MTPDPSAFGADLPLAERERAYSPSSCIGGDYQPFVAQYVQRSAAVRQRYPECVTLAYGAASSNTLDLFVPPGAGADAEESLPALLVFFHGGYWQELSKNESVFCADNCLAAGAAFAAIDYTLAPAATVEQIVLECRAALRCLYAQADTLGFDRRRIVVAGNSAGAHLAAMCCLRGWVGDANLPVGLPAAAVLVSGVYELTPLVGTTINDALALTHAAAAHVSPLRCDLAGFPPVLVCWGETETDVFAAQSRFFAQAIGAATATAPTVFAVPGRNHFDVILELAQAGTALGDGTLGMLGRQPPGP